MSEVWFTSDTHFGHGNIITHMGRPFENVQEMDDAIVANWNAVVKRGDRVYFLGDFCLGDPAPYFKRLNGQIHFVRGNHDKAKDAVYQQYCTTFNEVNTVKWDGHRFFLSHYAHRVWPQSHRGAFHLYGHSHGMLDEHGRSCDVGTDPWGFSPVHVGTIFEKLSNRMSVDHHPVAY